MGQAYTLEEVGRKMGVTRERVRQIEAQAPQPSASSHHSAQTARLSRRISSQTIPVKRHGNPCRF
jgi:hypothetical protein